MNSRDASDGRQAGVDGRAGPGAGPPANPYDPTAAVIERLEAGNFAPRPAGTDKWSALCPAHPDRNPSLSVSRGADNVALVFCHAGCECAAVVGALGLTESDLFPPREPARHAGRGEARPGRNGRGPAKVHALEGDVIRALQWGLEKRYGKKFRYSDKKWEYGPGRLFEVRFDAADGTKAYRTYHKVPGGYVSGDPGDGPLPLYRLADVGAAGRVFVVEGPKCVDLVVALGLRATTSPHGARAAARSDWSPLAGKEVVIIPDNDAAGEGYARDVSALLRRLDPPAAVRLLRLPGLPEGGDIEQWLAACPDSWGPDECRAALEKLVDLDPGAAGATAAARGPGADAGLARLPKTDLGNAERLVARHGADMRYCHPWGRWLVWDGRRWRPDDTGEARRRARQTVRGILAEAAALEDAAARAALVAWARASEKRDRLAALLHLAEAELPVVPDAMDADGWLLNCRNGTVDLRTGALRPHDRRDFITKICDVDYDPGAACPLWDSTLALFFRRDDPARRDALVDYWQRLCGYATAGVVHEHVLPVAFGSGSNGKSTVLGAVLSVLGPDYAMKCPPEMLMARANDAHPCDRADLFGKRLVLAMETEQGRRLNEALVKELTGADRVRARHMRENFWEFSSTHTLIMATNHKPAVRGTDHGIWRRIRLVPFTVCLSDAEADRTVPERLRAESPGILAWLVRGCLEWRRRGLDAPPEVAEATADYRREQDILGSFLAECTLSDPSVRVKAGELYARYAEWAKSSNEPALSLTAFGTAVQERGVEKRTSNGVWYIGLAIRPNPSRDSEKGERNGSDYDRGWD
jgi:putative DNA primase/helicase